jgi:broad specificity phosphatase PhoE
MRLGAAGIAAIGGCAVARCVRAADGAPACRPHTDMVAEMSDLFCPASIVLARHGEAVYEDEHAMADKGGSLSLRGRAEAAELADSLQDRKVAMIYASSMTRAVQTAEIAAAALGVPVRVRHDLREFDIGDLVGQRFDLRLFEPVAARWRAGDLAAGCPGAETGADVLTRVKGVLETIADEHRGETVLVVSHGGAIKLAVSALARGVGDCWTDQRELPGCAVVELEADADGWRCLSWAGSPLA